MGAENFLVRRREGVLFGGEQLFVELLTRTQTGILDLDVDIGSESGQIDHPAGQVGDLDGGAHIKNEDFIALPHHGGFEHEAAGFGNGHEIADDVGMGDGERTALLQLLAETGDDAAVAAEHITETGGDELGLSGNLALADAHAEGLHVDLGQTLGSTHDVGGVDSLVGRHHDKTLHTVFHGRIGQDAGAHDIGQNGLTGIFLHQRHMLIGRSMENGLRTVFAHHVVDPGGYAHIANDRHDIDFRIIILDLEADVVHRGLGYVEEHQTFQTEGTKLAAEFAADGAGSSGNEHHLALKFVDDVLHIYPDFRTPEQILDAHLGQTAHHGLTGIAHTTGRGQLEHLHMTALAKTHQTVALQIKMFATGEQNGMDVFVGNQLAEIFLALDGKEGMVAKPQGHLVAKTEIPDNAVGTRQAFEQIDTQGLVGLVAHIDEHQTQGIVAIGATTEQAVKVDDRRTENQQKTERQTEIEHNPYGQLAKGQRNRQGVKQTTHENDLDKRSHDQPEGFEQTGMADNPAIGAQSPETDSRQNNAQNQYQSNKRRWQRNGIKRKQEQDAQQRR